MVTLLSLHSNRTLNETGAITRKWGIAITVLTMLLLGPMWTLELQIRIVVAHFKLGLMGHISGIIEDSAKGSLNCGGLAEEISEGMNINKWPKDHSCDILARDMAIFDPCTKSLSETKIEEFRLMVLAEETSAQSSIDCAM